MLLMVVEASLCLFGSFPALAAWTPDGIRVSSTSLKQQDPKLALLDDGGVLVVWVEQRPWPYPWDRYYRSDLFSTAFTVFGDRAPGWADTQINAFVERASDNGSIIAWSDFRSGAFDLYAQRLVDTKLGIGDWDANGIPIRVGSSCSAPKVTADVEGGAFVSWREAALDGHWELRILRVTRAGDRSPGWPDSGFVVATTDDQGFELSSGFVICADGFGGVLIAWSTTTGSSLFCQRIAATATISPGWPGAGTLVCSAPGQQIPGAIVPTGDGGAAVAWQDTRADAGDIYASSISASGEVAPGLPADGLPVCTAADEQWIPAACSDGSGGALLAWTDRRTGERDVYTTRMTSDGMVANGWPSDGLRLCGATGDQAPPLIVPDDGDGAIILWADYRDDPSRTVSAIYTQHVLGSGSIAVGWEVDGKKVKLGPGRLGPTSLVSDGEGGAYCAWNDSDIALFTNKIFVQRIGATGVVGPPPPSIDIALHSPRPNPATSAASVAFTLRSQTEVEIDIFDLSGRLVKRLIPRSTFGPGTHAVTWQGDLENGGSARPGVYAVMLRATDTSLSKRLILIR